MRKKTIILTIILLLPFTYNRLLIDSAKCDSSIIYREFETPLYLGFENTEGIITSLPEVIRYKVFVNIETEPDGTWRPNQIYEASFLFMLEWVNISLAPKGVKVTVLPFGRTQQYNVTTPGVPGPSEWTFFYHFNTSSLPDFVSGREIDLSYRLDIWNGTYSEIEWWQYGRRSSNVLTYIMPFPTIYINITAEEEQLATHTDITELTQAMNSLNGQVNSLKTQIGEIAALVDATRLLLITLIIIVVVQLVLILLFARRKISRKKE